MTYTAELRAADIEIALAMGWRKVQLHTKEQFATVPPDWEETEKNKLWFLGRSVNALVPYFHATQDACEMLLHWIAMQDWSTREKFSEIIRRKFELSDKTRVDELIQMMLARPEDIAEAAYRVILENNRGAGSD